MRIFATATCSHIAFFFSLNQFFCVKSAETCGCCASKMSGKMQWNNLDICVHYMYFFKTHLSIYLLLFNLIPIHLQIVSMHRRKGGTWSSGLSTYDLCDDPPSTPIPPILYPLFPILYVYIYIYTYVYIYIYTYMYLYILLNFTSSWDFVIFRECWISRSRCNIWCSVRAQGSHEKT